MLADTFRHEGIDFGGSFLVVVQESLLNVIVGEAEYGLESGFGVGVLSSSTSHDHDLMGL